LFEISLGLALGFSPAPVFWPTRKLVDSMPLQPGMSMLKNCSTKNEREKKSGA
jgi:hypothetical protein